VAIDAFVFMLQLVVAVTGAVPSKKLSIVALIAIVLGASQVHAQAALDYARGAGADECPSAAVLRALVAERLGYDPFREDAQLAVEVSIARDGDRLRAAIRLARDGEDAGVRELDEPIGACAPLIASVVLAISIAIDPEAAMGAPRAEPPLPQANDVEVPIEVVPPIRGPSLRGIVWLGAAGAFGLTPGLAGGVRAGGEIVVDETFSIGAGVTGLFSGPIAAGGAAIAGSIAAGELFACGWLAPLVVCAVIAGGASFGAGHGFEVDRQGDAAYAAIGARALVHQPIAGPLALRASIDLSAPLVRAGLVAGGERLWQTEPVTVEIGVAAALELGE
jgi:hypothetical protein